MTETTDQRRARVARARAAEHEVHAALSRRMGVVWRIPRGEIAHATGRRTAVMGVGAADFIGLLRGRGVAVEVKTGVGVLTPAQKVWRKAWEDAGGLYCVVGSAADVDKVMEG